MRTDRKLLELAAKAAGIGPVIGFAAEACELMIGPRNYIRYWRPLSDDGDALRLAVKIRLLVDVCNSYTVVCNEKVDPIEQDHGNDAFAATRRAIVRAAAAIGEPMP